MCSATRGAAYLSWRNRSALASCLAEVDPFRFRALPFPFLFFVGKWLPKSAVVSRDPLRASFRLFCEDCFLLDLHIAAPTGAATCLDVLESLHYSFSCHRASARVGYWGDIPRSGRQTRSAGHRPVTVKGPRSRGLFAFENMTHLATAIKPTHKMLRFKNVENLYGGSAPACGLPAGLCPDPALSQPSSPPAQGGIDSMGFVLVKTLARNGGLVQSLCDARARRAKKNNGFHAVPARTLRDFSCPVSARASLRSCPTPPNFHARAQRRPCACGTRRLLQPLPFLSFCFLSVTGCRGVPCRGDRGAAPPVGSGVSPV